MREIIKCFDLDTKITSSHNFDVMPQEITLKIRGDIEITIPIKSGDVDMSEITEFERYGEYDILKRMRYIFRLEVESDNYKVIKYKE